MGIHVLVFVLASLASAQEKEWTQAWQDDFNRSELGSDWQVFGKASDVKIADGRLEIAGEGKASVICTRSFPPDIRFEFDGGVLPGQPACDLTPGLCCGGLLGRSCGYHLAFGADWGKRNVLQRPGIKAIRDLSPAYRLEAGKNYHMMAIKDGSKVTLSADDHIVLSYDDPDPLGGPGFDRVSLITWSGIYVDNVKVYTKKGQSVRDVPWMVKLPPLPLNVVHGKMAPVAGWEEKGSGSFSRNGPEGASQKMNLTPFLPQAIDAFNAGDVERAYKLFAAMPDSLLKAAGLAGCLGHLDYAMQEGQGEALARLFTRLAGTASSAEQPGLRACAFAARLRDDVPQETPKEAPKDKPSNKQKAGKGKEKPRKRAEIRCTVVNGLRLIQIGPENNPYYWRAKYDIARLLYWGAAEANDPVRREQCRELFKEILTELPDHAISRQYAGEKVPWGPEFSQHPEGTPAWAAALHEAYGRNTAMLNYWIQHRQAPDGTFGGGPGDDVELFRSWQPLGAISTATTVVKEGITRLCDGIWHMPAITNGMWGGIMDVEHGMEYTADTQPVMLFLDYGEPEFYERNLEATRHIHDTLTGTNQRGVRQFKSIDIGGKGVGVLPEHQADVPYHARAMKAVMWLTWAGNPTARTLFLEWADLWVNAAMSQEGGKPAGVVPPAVWYPSGSIIKPGGKWWQAGLGWSYFEWPFSTFHVLDSLNCAYSFTHDPKYLIPMQRTLDLFWSSPEREAKGLTAGSPEWVTATLQHYPLLGENIPGYRCVSRDFSYDENIQAMARNDGIRLTARAYTRYLIDHDLSAFSETILKETESRRFNFELKTREVLATDRAGIPVDNTFAAYTGAPRRWSDMGLPGCAVTWVAEDGGFAALVQSSSDRQLKLRVHQFKDRPIQLGMRLWQLIPGSYRMVTGPEEEIASGLRFVEGKPRTFDLRWRGQTEYIDVPARRSFSVDIRLVQPAKRTEHLPDLAIGRNDVTITDTPGNKVDITVRVHNIGSAETPQARVVLLAGKADGKPLAEARLPVILAPNDLLPKFQDVRIEVPKKELAEGWTVSVTPAEGTEEANPWNNTRSGSLR